jgi:hypothetical protein
VSFVTSLLVCPIPKAFQDPQANTFSPIMKTADHEKAVRADP